MADKKAQLIIEGAAPVELPILSGTMGPDVVDVRGLTSQGVFTYDPGFMSTAACESKITFIDGDKGILQHLGYPIDQLAEKSSFLEVCYLLLNGDLPNAKEFETYWRPLLPLDELFDDVVDSSAVGLRKPDPRIYELSLSRLGVTAADAVFIDDAPGNVDGARAVGMSAVLIGQQRADVPAALAELRSLVAL